MTHGRVTVNGETIRELGTKADLSQDDIRVDGVRLRAPDAPVYLLLRKPKGVVTTRHDPQGRPTVMGLVPAVAGLFPVGRLDVTTEGLLILTNDGAFAERVSHPRYEVPRVYLAKVHGVPNGETLRRLTVGIAVEGDRLAADSVRILKAGQNAWLEVRLHEGKKHEVRRLLEAVGHPVAKLRRIAIGPVSDRGLKAGEFRHLRPEEIRALQDPVARQSVAPRTSRPPGPTRRGRRRGPQGPTGTGRHRPTSDLRKRSAGAGPRRPVDTRPRGPKSPAARGAARRSAAPKRRRA
jgi:23S rRNA pseudouridine2605 synthase